MVYKPQSVILILSAECVSWSTIANKPIEKMKRASNVEEGLKVPHYNAFGRIEHQTAAKGEGPKVSLCVGRD